jgi:hypothetical protein
MVAQWLDTIQMSQYKDLFLKNDVTGEDLLELVESDLITMGIDKASSCFV